LDRLLGSGKCIGPPHEVIRLLISAHHGNPSAFKWTEVNVRSREYEEAITHRDFDEKICSEQRSQQFQQESDFKNKWKRLRPKLDKILAKEPSKRPSSYRDAVAIAARDRGVLWGFGQRLYKHVSQEEPTELQVRSFMEVCPPFRAACYGLVMAWYNWSLRPHNGKKQPDKAGRNDLMMATYLPYCGRFISNDWAQRKNLRDVAIEASIDCEILSCNELHSQFSPWAA
jgi:hypothetical protein